MKHKTVILLALALLVIVFIAQSFILQEGVADGWYDLTVEIAPESSVGVKSLGYLALYHAEQADAALAKIDTHGGYEHLDSVEPFSINAGFSHRVSMGVSRDYVQEFSDIIVVLNRDDGSREVHRLTVPDHRVSKHVVVSPHSRVKTVE